MPCITVVQLAGLAVQHAQEQGQEHILCILLHERAVHLGHNQFRLLLIGGYIAEQRPRHCHHQRSRHTFAAHVADTEEQLILPHIEIVQVAAYLFGRGYHAVYIQIQSVRKRREHLRQHGLLYLLCDMQFTAYTFLFHVSLMQAVYITVRTMHDKA